MDKQDDLFSPNHIQSWKIAWWAKQLSSVVLVLYIVLAALQIAQVQISANYSSQLFLNLRGFILDKPFDAFRAGVNVLSTLLKGVVYFLVLKGVSLGLNMIIETDINYREQKGGQDE